MNRTLRSLGRTLAFILAGILFTRVAAFAATETLIIRAAGPGFANVGGIGGLRILQNPQIALYDSNRNVIVTNSSWNGPVMVTPTGVSDGVTARQATKTDFSAVGAFALTPGSLDSAMVVQVPPGVYTAVVTGQPGDEGNCIVEVYEVPTDGICRIVNLSTRAKVFLPAKGYLIAGLVIGGNTPKKALIRGIGTALTDFGFDLTQVITIPNLSLYDSSGKIIWANEIWNIDAATGQDVSGTVAPVMAEVGAFPLPLGVPGPGTGSINGQTVNISANAAGVVDLSPGPHTFSLLAGGLPPDILEGTALVEAYDADWWTDRKSVV